VRHLTLDDHVYVVGLFFAFVTFLC
jgi:hypothetical protein